MFIFKSRYVQYSKAIETKQNLDFRQSQRTNVNGVEIVEEADHQRKQNKTKRITPNRMKSNET